VDVSPNNKLRIAHGKNRISKATYENVSFQNALQASQMRLRKAWHFHSSEKQDKLLAFEIFANASKDM
jgi:hypothetical protein